MLPVNETWSVDEEELSDEEEKHGISPQSLLLKTPGMKMKELQRSRNMLPNIAYKSSENIEKHVGMLVFKPKSDNDIKKVNH